MKTLTFATKEDAEARSREEWEKVLGRKKRPEDVTEFLWAVDGSTAIVPPEDESRLTKAERAALSTAVLKVAASI